MHEQLKQNPPSPKFHAILEAVGTADPSLYAYSESYLAPGGVFTSVGPQPGVGGGITGFLRLMFTLTRPAFLGGVKRKWTYVSATLMQVLKS